MQKTIGYRIFDSLDRPCSPIEDAETNLYGTLQELRDEAEEEGNRLTYAIGTILEDGEVVF